MHRLYSYPPGTPPNIVKFFDENPPGHEVFTHIDNETGIVRHFQVTKLIEFLLREVEADRLTQVATPLSFHLAKHDYKMIMTRRGIEEWRLQRLQKPWIDYPVLFCQMPDGKHLMIDGNHRYVRWYRDGLRVGKGVLFEESVWSKFLVHPPKELEALMLIGL